MRNAVSLLLGLFTYVVLTTLLFGDPVEPLFLLSLSDRLGISGLVGQATAIVCMMALVFFIPRVRPVEPPLRLSAFIAAAILVPTFYVVTIADWKRTRIIVEFEADLVEQNSLLTSLGKAPADFQFYLHAAALKNCQPYGWSYRTMGFYPLAPRVSVNVIPHAWLTMCGITRE